jgi:hypothetical protein
MIFLRDRTLFGVDVRLSAYPVFSRMSFDVAPVNITPACPAVDVSNRPAIFEVCRAPGQR